MVKQYCIIDYLFVSYFDNFVTTITCISIRVCFEICFKNCANTESTGGFNCLIHAFKHVSNKR